MKLFIVFFFLMIGIVANAVMSNERRELVEEVSFDEADSMDLSLGHPKAKRSKTAGEILKATGGIIQANYEGHCPTKADVPVSKYMSSTVYQQFGICKTDKDMLGNIIGSYRFTDCKVADGRVFIYGNYYEDGGCGASGNKNFKKITNKPLVLTSCQENGLSHSYFICQSAKKNHKH